MILNLSAYLDIADSRVSSIGSYFILSPVAAGPSLKGPLTPSGINDLIISFLVAASSSSMLPTKPTL